MSEMVVDEAFIQRAKDLVSSAEAGNDEEVKMILDELAAMKETSLFTELGKLTRELHETFKAFRSDSRINELAESDIPDARERLHYVVNMTQQAADTTMTQIENAIPLCEHITEGTEDLLSSWDRFTRKEMQVEEFRELIKTLKVFLQTANKDSKGLMSYLNEILMAQDMREGRQLFGKITVQKIQKKYRQKKNPLKMFMQNLLYRTENSLIFLIQILMRKRHILMVQMEYPDRKVIHLIMNHW